MSENQYFFFREIEMKNIFCFLMLQAAMVSASYADELNDYSGTKCATFSPANIQRMVENKKRKTDYLLDELLPREYDTLSNKYISPRGYFAIHYAVGGIDGVSSFDANRNGIPDYVDSVAYYFDYAYAFEVQKLKYNAPPKDKGRGGTEEYDVYIIDLGNERGMGYGYSVTDDPAIPVSGKADIFSSFIVVDNNYSPTDSSLNDSLVLKRSYHTFGIDGLKITAAHEFHHAIQFGYGFPDPGNSAINEMCSTFMEFRLFPEVKDYQAYIGKMLLNLDTYPFSNPAASTGYAWSAFFIKLFIENGNDNIVLNLWENISNNKSSFDALEESLQKNLGTNISAQLKEMSDWFYYTGSRAIDGMYFPDANKYPLVKSNVEVYYSEPSFMHSGSLKPFAYYPIRLLFNIKDNMTGDTLDMVLFNDDYKSANANTQYSNQFNVSISEQLNNCDSLILNGRFCYKSSENKDKIIPIFYQYNGVNIIDDEVVFPNPVTESDEYIAFPVGYNRRLLSKATLTIFDMDNRQILNKEIKVGVFEHRKVLYCHDIPSDMGSGVYLYKIDYGDGTKYGKFAVKKSK